RLRAEGRPVPPHVELARVTLDDVDRRVAPVGLVLVTRRDVDPERSLVRIAERVPAQRLGDDDVLVEAARSVVRPWIHSAGELPGDARRATRLLGRPGL